MSTNSQLAVMTWLPASSPPTDSETYPVWLPSGKWTRGYHHEGHWFDSYGYQIEPTHWLRIEPPGEQAKAKQIDHPMFRQYSQTRP